MIILVCGMAMVILLIVIVAGQLELLYHRTHPPDDGTRVEHFEDGDDERP